MRAAAWCAVLLAASLCAGQTAAPEPAPDRVAGKIIFESQCALCHGVTGTGGRGPSLNRAKLDRAPDDKALHSVITRGIDPEMPAAWQLSPTDVANLAAFVRSLSAVPAEAVPGEPKKGALVYRTEGCSGCHIVAGQGESFGPELTAIGIRRGATHLRQALVDPGAFVGEDFMLVEAVGNAGTVRGIRANEDTFTIQIRDPSGRFYSFRKSELRDLRRLSKQSAMPAYKSLSAEELDNLIAYLVSLRGAQ